MYLLVGFANSFSLRTSRRHCLNFSITRPLVFTPNSKMAPKQYANTIQYMYTNRYGNAKSRK